MIPESINLPREVFSGYWSGSKSQGALHCQGIAVDTQRKYMYFSFTTMLIKTDLEGNFIGSVTGLMGHLGCIDFNDRDGRVWGSLEYKNDQIGRNILKRIGAADKQIEDAFYIVMFDVDKIDRPNMDATADGVMKSVYLADPVRDFKAKAVNQGREVDHRYGVSGIDGTTFGPMPGSNDGKQYLFVACGIYGDVERTDNDHQIILCYDTSDWEEIAQPLNQDNMHHVGPEHATHRFYVKTGNTTWGVQNLEYDPYSGHFIMAVYRGKKEQYPNDVIYLIDGTKAPVWGKLVGVEPEEEGELLSLYGSGWTYDQGTTGLHAFGDGYYYVSYKESNILKGECSRVRLCKWDGKGPLALVEE